MHLVKARFYKFIFVMLAAGIALAGCSSGGSNGNNGGNNNNPPPPVGPTITLVGENPMTVSVGTQFIDPGAAATDSAGVSLAVTSTGNVDMNALGDYTITYSATDGNGTTSTSNRQVQVTPKVLRVEISYFGEGSITSSSTSLACEERFCVAEVYEGDSLTVNAQAAAPWTFARWQGCDATAGTECTITPTKNVLLDAAFDSPDPLTFRSNVLQLTEGQIRSIIGFDPESGLLTLNAGTDITGFDPGTIIASTGIYNGPGDPGNLDIHFARRIKRVLSLAGSVIFVDTEAATLSDIVEVGSLVVDTSMLAIDTARLPPGITVQERAPVQSAAADGASTDVVALNVDLVLYDLDGDFGTKFDQVRVSGTMDFDLDADWRFDFKFREFREGLQEWRYIQRINWNDRLALEFGGQVPFRSDQIKAAPAIWLQPIVIGPVVFTPRIQLYFGYDARMEFDLGASIVLDREVVGGWHYIKGIDTRFLGSFDATADIGVDIPSNTDPLRSPKIVAEMGPELALEFLAYGVVGPYLAAEGYGGFEAFLAAACPRLFEYQTYYGGKGKIGGKFTILGWQMAMAADIFDIRRTQQLSGCGADDVPAEPTNLRATLTDSNSVQLDWDHAGLEEGLSFRIFRNFKELDRKWLSNSYADRNVEPNTRYCYQVVAVNQYGTVSELSDVACATTPQGNPADPAAPMELVATAVSSSAITLTWTESSSAEVIKYVVYNASGVQPYAASDALSSPTTLVQLLPDTEYCFEVTALGDAGAESATSNVACATTLPKDAANWTIYLACQGREYLIEEKMDLDVNFTDTISIVGEGFDYPGTPLVYALSGVYQAETQILSGDIIWTFEGQSQRRRDLFSASLAGGDSGDVNMDQVEVTGCDALIRFVEGSLDAAEASSMPKAEESKALSDEGSFFEIGVSQ